ncbi:MAG: hypothetical protein HYX78_12285 [Armatimonadetes bacterium]|nr:hypothetical protein [Armatimonadota bacterium]
MKHPDALISAPAMVMAFGIFIRAAGRFLLELAFGERFASQAENVLAIPLAILWAVLICFLIVRVRRNWRSMWAFTIGHFALGTWVAGTSVLSVAIAQVFIPLAKTLNCLAVVLWVAYMAWFFQMIRHTDQRGRINGLAFHTTVSTQSLVVSTLIVRPDLSPQAVYALIGLNVLGVIFYCAHFSLIWIVRGVRDNLAHWVPPNNITHGALSISTLAAELLVVKAPFEIPCLITGVQVLWTAAASLFLITFFVELNLLRTRTHNLLAFQMPNYARNFTYGMFFACTYYGFTEIPNSIMHSVMSMPVIICLAILAAIVNMWEAGHHITTALANRSTARRKAS